MNPLSDGFVVLGSKIQTAVIGVRVGHVCKGMTNYVTWRSKKKTSPVYPCVHLSRQNTKLLVLQVERFVTVMCFVLMEADYR